MILTLVHVQTFALALIFLAFANWDCASLHCHACIPFLDTLLGVARLDQTRQRAGDIDENKVSPS